MGPFDLKQQQNQVSRQNNSFTSPDAATKQHNMDYFEQQAERIQHIEHELQKLKHEKERLEEEMMGDESPSMSPDQNNL